MSNYLNLDEFLTGIIGGTEDFVIEGLGTIKIKALDYLDIKEITTQSKNDDLEAGLLMVFKGIAEPKLSMENLEQLGKAKPGLIAAISKRVSQLSGMSEDSEKKVGIGS